MHDRSLWREWKLVAYLIWNPDPEFVNPQLLCPECARGLNRRRGVEVFAPVGKGPIEQQLQQFLDGQNKMLSDIGYQFAHYLEEHAAPTTHYPRGSHYDRIRSSAEIIRELEPFFKALENQYRALWEREDALAAREKALAGSAASQTAALPAANHSPPPKNMAAHPRDDRRPTSHQPIAATNNNARRTEGSSKTGAGPADRRTGPPGSDRAAALPGGEGSAAAGPLQHV